MAIDEITNKADLTRWLRQALQEPGIVRALASSFGSPVQIDPGDTSADGSASTSARSDHQHAVSPKFVKTSGTGAEDDLRVIRGIVTTHATAPTTEEGSGFTLSNPGSGTGVVTVTFDTAFSNDPAVLPTCVSSGECQVDTLSTSSVRIIRRNSAGTLTHGQLHFIAIGPA